MRLRTFVLAAVALLAAGAAQAGSVDLSFNDDNFDAWLTFGVGPDEDAQFLLGGRYLYSDDDDDDASVPGLVAAFSSRPSANDEIRFFLGAQGLIGEAQDADVQGIAIGGALTWAPAAWKGAFIGARLFYAPGVFCFGDTESVIEWAGQAGYEINERVRVFLEYSKLTADVEITTDDEVEVDVEDGLTVGIGIRF